MKFSAQKPINRSDLAQMTDLNALRALVIAQGDQLAKRDELLVQRDHLIDTLTEQLKRLRHLKFGASSERFDPSQQALFEETLNADIAAVEAEIEAALAASVTSPADAETSPEAVLKPIQVAPQKPVRKGLARASSARGRNPACKSLQLRGMQRPAASVPRRNQ